MTQAANYPNRLDPRKSALDAFNFTERKDPEFIQFGNGETVTGILVGIERVAIKSPEGRESITSRFLVEDIDTGDVKAFLGTYQLNSKIRPNDVGHVVMVTCTGSDKAVSRNGNAMKTFSVKVSDRMYPGWMTQDRFESSESDLPTNL